jgi:uncharacterized protein YndB with AHSA1/START domain
MRSNDAALVGLLFENREATGAIEKKFAQQGAIEMSTAIHQEVDFKASPQRVYAVLTDAKEFSAFSGLPAEIGLEAGGAFKCFGGQITGRMIEVVPNQRIVQTWHVAMWPDGVNSTVKFQLKEQGSGTRIILDHSDFPEGNREHLDAGWPRMYWEPMKKYLA